MGGERKGMVNVYQCKDCRRTIVTVNLVEGTTPFMIECAKEEGGCDGDMQSAFYRVYQGLEPTHEWYLPTAEEVEALYRELPDPEGWVESLEKYGQEYISFSRNVIEQTMKHVEQGGLILRPVMK